MRKIASGLFISIDGVVESPDKWQFDHFDEGMMAAMKAALDAADTVLMGRVTYEEWAPYWPTSKDEPFASFINRVPKYVASTKLGKVGWGRFDNISLIKGPLSDELPALKRKPGKDITVAGSPTLVRSLLQKDLLDELTLLIHPVIAGKGKRLFSDGSALKRLKLTESKTTPTGVLIATYRRRDEIRPPT